MDVQYQGVPGDFKVASIVVPEQLNMLTCFFSFPQSLFPILITTMFTPLDYILIYR